MSNASARIMIFRLIFVAVLIGVLGAETDVRITVSTPQPQIENLTKSAQKESLSVSEWHHYLGYPASQLPTAEKQKEQTSVTKKESAEITPEPAPAGNKPQIELEITQPLSISKEQLVRLRKFLNQKGISVKNPVEEAGHGVNKVKVSPSVFK